MQFQWEDYTKKQGDSYGPNEAHTARGWCRLVDHPAKADKVSGVYFATSGYDCVGNYLDYEHPEYGHPTGSAYARNDCTIHAVAYYQTFTKGYGPSTISLGSDWFASVQEAREWIMTKVAAHCGQPMLV